MATPRVTPHVRSGTGKVGSNPRRFWTRKEEEQLIECLEQLLSEGVKIDGSLRGGYVKSVGNMLADRLPGCGITDTHVKSKITVWRKTHSQCLTILAASGANGFSFDPVNKMFIEDKEGAWAEHAKVYPEGVKLVKGKCFPWLDRWNMVLGTDKATGNQLVDVGDAIKEIYSTQPTQSGNHISALGEEQQHDTSTKPLDLHNDTMFAASVTPDDDDCTESKLKKKKKTNNWRRQV